MHHSPSHRGIGGTPPGCQEASNGDDYFHDHGTPPVKHAHQVVPRAVSTRGDVVVKVQDPEASRRERLRTLAGGMVARQTGLFVVPEIVSFDDARGEIV